jgi:undecaprenyl-diphosphatase
MSPTPWDEHVMRWVADHRADRVNDVAYAVMDVGVHLAGAAVCALVVSLFVRRFRYRWAAAAALAASVVAGLLASGLKHVFDRPRPPADLALVAVHGLSFPSTQAAQTAAVATALLVAPAWASRALLRTAVVAFSLALVGIGGCMVYLGAHWPTDVLAGWAVGVTCGAAAALAARRLAVTVTAARLLRSAG